MMSFVFPNKYRVVLAAEMCSYIEAMKIYKVKGSGENTYNVHVGPKGEDGVVIYCDCKAGIFGKMCKHKIAIATGDPSLLINQGDAEKLAETADNIKRRPLGVLIQDLSDFRKEYDAAKRKMDKARKKLEKAMKG